MFFDHGSFVDHCYAHLGKAWDSHLIFEGCSSPAVSDCTLVHDRASEMLTLDKGCTSIVSS